MMKKRFLAILLVLALIIGSFAGCGGGDQATNAPESSIAVVVQDDEPIRDWDPAIAYAAESHVFFNIYETLLRYDPVNDEYINVLAESYSVSDDALVWTFNIRQGVKFHDGSICNAEAVKYSLDRNKNMQKSACHIWNEVKEVKVVDEYTVEIHLTVPIDLTEAVSCQYDAFIYSPNAGDDFDESSKWFYEGNECGTGPYTLESYTTGSNAVFKQFEDYWGGWDGPHFDKVVVRVATEVSTRRQMVENGEGDIALTLTPSDAEAMASNPNLTVDIYDASKNYLCFFNTLQPPFDNILVRKAIAYSFPYETVIKDIKLGKYASLPTDVGTPAGNRGATSTYPYYYDLEKAKALLEEAGYGDGLTIGITATNAYEDMKKMIELWKSELSKIGVDLNIELLAWEAAFSKAKSANPEDRPDLWVVEQWTDALSSYSVYSSIALADASWNFAGVNYPELDKALLEAFSMTPFDRDKSTEMLEKVGEQYADKCFVINLCDEKGIIVHRNDFKGYAANKAYDGVIFWYDCYRE